MPGNETCFVIVATGDFFASAKDARIMAEVLQRKRDNKVIFSAFKCSDLTPSGLSHTFGYATTAKLDKFSRLQDAQNAADDETSRRKNEGLRFVVIREHFI